VFLRFGIIRYFVLYLECHNYSEIVDKTLQTMLFKHQLLQMVNIRVRKQRPEEISRGQTLYLIILQNQGP